MSNVFDLRNVQHLCSVCFNLLSGPYKGFLDLTLLQLCILNPLAFDRDKLIYSSATWKSVFFAQQFMDSVKRFCTPVAVVSLSSILISFLTVLMSDCSVSPCPLYPWATCFWKRRTCFWYALIKNCGGLSGCRVNERRWHFKRTTLMNFSHCEVLGR